jgi:hypothetical protein
MRLNAIAICIALLQPASAFTAEPIVNPEDQPRVVVPSNDAQSRTASKKPAKAPDVVLSPDRRDGLRPQPDDAIERGKQSAEVARQRNQAETLSAAKQHAKDKKCKTKNCAPEGISTE